jgi:hypothetical protein
VLPFIEGVQHPFGEEILLVVVVLLVLESAYAKPCMPRAVNKILAA